MKETVQRVIRLLQSRHSMSRGWKRPRSFGGKSDLNGRRNLSLDMKKDTFSEQNISGGFNLGDFLDKESRVGTQESTGEFSVSNEKALEKLAQFSLVGEYTWLLKFLQSVFHWEPEKLDIEQTERYTVFYFCPATELPTEREVADNLRDGLSQRDEPLSQLCLSLRALVQRAGLAFVLSINGEPDCNEPIYSGRDVFHSMSDYGNFSSWKTARSERGFQLFVSHFKGKESITGRLLPTFTNWERRGNKIAKLLMDNAVFHPTPIRLNGVHLNTITGHRTYGLSSRSRLIALGGIQDPQLDNLRLPRSFRESTFSLSSTNRQDQEEIGEQCEFGAWYILKAKSPNTLRQNLSYFAKPLHEILWIKNGVVVERNIARGHSRLGQLTILLSAQNFPTDLSGLALIRSEDRSSIERHTLEKVALKIEDTSRDLSFLDREDENELASSESSSHVNTVSVLKNDIAPSVGFGILAFVSLGPALPVAGSFTLGAGLAGLFGYCSRRYRNSESVAKKQKEKWLVAIREDFEKLADLKPLNFLTNQSEAGAGIEKEELFRPRKHENDGRTHPFQPKSDPKKLFQPKRDSEGESRE